jgi:peptidoglycan hydrolase CwlO-like protein
MEGIRIHNGIQDEKILDVEKKCNSNDHAITKTCTDISYMKTDIAVMKVDIDWVKKIQWAVLTMSGGSIIAALINLVFQIEGK